MDYKIILNLMKEMNHTDLTRLEIEEEGLKICIEKAAPTVTVAQPPHPNTLLAPGFAPAASQPPHPDTLFAPGFAPAVLQPQMSVQQPAVTIASAAATGANDSNTEKPGEELGGKKLVSPMVGTFYAASAPDKPPFVKVGDKVKKGQPICIIEAMKLMNEIEAEQDGEIVKILATNEQMVEFGQPLFLIK